MAETDLATMLATLDVIRRSGEFVFVSAEEASASSGSWEALIREDEGLTAIVDRRVADAEGLGYDFIGAWLTLTVFSALDAVGLTAAVSAALAAVQVPANVVAGLHHDHIVVPVDRVDDAVACLAELRSRSALADSYLARYRQRHSQELGWRLACPAPTTIPEMAEPDLNAGADVTLPADAVQEVVRAKLLLESPHLAARLADLLGGPIEALVGSVGDKNADRVRKLTQKALDHSLSAALKTLDVSAAVDPSPRLHMAAASAAGAAGGAFGWGALAIELPISTGIILRSIADIARGEGEQLDDPEVRMQCLSVLALGGTSHADDAAETGYFATRAALASAVSQAASYLASEAALASRSAPALVRLVAMIAERFGVQVSAKIAATAVPVIGAVTGGAINSIFMDHFQCIARGHFMIRRLERRFGTLAVRAQMEKLDG